jgi:hypothetical protein
MYEPHSDGLTYKSVPNRDVYRRIKTLPASKKAMQRYNFFQTIQCKLANLDEI